METIRKINDDLFIAGQIDVEQLPSLIEAGLRSVLNLRQPQELGFLLEEADKAELLGLAYSNLPFAIDGNSVESATRILLNIEQMPKPILIHCDNALRAAAIALMYVAIHQGVSPERAFDQAKQLGLFEVPV